MRPYLRVTEGQGCPECYKKNTGRGPFSARQKEQAINMLKMGIPVKQIAATIGAHIMTIYRIRDSMPD